MISFNLVKEEKERNDICVIGSSCFIMASLKRIFSSENMIIFTASLIRYQPKNKYTINKHQLVNMGL